MTIDTDALCVCVCGCYCFLALFERVCMNVCSLLVVAVSEYVQTERVTVHVVRSMELKLF